MKIYLAGAINKKSDLECIEWRENCKKLLNHECVDPMIRDYRGKESVNFKEIVETDKADILNSNIILVKYDSPSVGTSMEILYAYMLDKLIFLVTSEINLSPWLLYHSSKIFSSIKEACEYINNLV